MAYQEYDKEAYSPREAAYMLGYHYRTILNRIKSGKIRAYKIDATYRVPKEEIDRIKHGRISDT